MKSEAKIKLKKLLINHEQLRIFPYNDTTGHITIGVGRNLTNRGVSTSEAMTMLDNDIEYFLEKLQSLLPWFSKLNEARQIALIDMCFNLGVNAFLEFNSTLNLIEHGYYDIAADEMLKSKWAHQVPGRALSLAKIIKYGMISSI